MQVVGDDLHLTAIVGAKQMVEEALEHGLDVAWVEHADKPKHSHSVGEPMLVPNLQIESFKRKERFTGMLTNVHITPVNSELGCQSIGVVLVHCFP